MFDAGSSHTSLFVYQWPADKEKDTGLVSQALACEVEGQRAVPGRDCQDRALGEVRQTLHWGSKQPGDVPGCIAAVQAGLDLGPICGTLTLPPC